MNQQTEQPPTQQQPPQPTTSSTTEPIPISEILKEASKIKEYKGTRDYDLSSFIREVELFIPIFKDTTLEDYVFQRCIYNKIQGAALDVIRTIGPTPTWQQIKKELITNFGVRETYHQLFHKALALKNYNVSQYYYNLRDILNKLNEKFAQDSDKPIEFCTKNNESMILKTFVNNIPPYMASIIHSRDISNVRSAFYTLEETGILRTGSNNIPNRNIQYREPQRRSDNIGYYGHLNNSRQHGQSNNSRQFYNSGQYGQSNYSGQFHDSSRSNNGQTNNGQFGRGNDFNFGHSGQHRQTQPNNSGRFKPEQHRQTSGQYRNPFRQNSNNGPMEIEHIYETNFRSPAQAQVYR